MDNTSDAPLFAPPSPSDSTIFGPKNSYRVIRLLGRGTMASVYLAEQVSMARPVALKILSHALSSDPEFVERFLREARAAARLNHPNIVVAIDFGEFQNRFFLAMEFIDGASLSALVARDGAVEEKRVVGIGLQVLAALSHAHAHSVLHLDVKPANIMICKDGRVKLTDFGLAMILDSQASAEASRKGAGTPYYMAPEQVEGGKLDWRTDQFSLGASLYEAVTGMKPFQGGSVSDILVKRFFEKPKPAWKCGRKVSRAFSAVLAKMLSRSPEGRYRTVGELDADLNLVLAGKKPSFAVMDEGMGDALSGSDWSSLTGSVVIDRVDGVIRRKRWTWMLYSSLLFLAVLSVYAAKFSRALVGPKPPANVGAEWLVEAERPPPETTRRQREMWERAVLLDIRAEKEPGSENLRHAVRGYRELADDFDAANTVYAIAARRWAEALAEELRKRGGEDAEGMDARGDFSR